MVDLRFDQEKKTAESKLVDETVHLLHSNNMTEQCLATQNTLTVAQLAPYCGWEKYIRRVKRDLVAFQESAKSWPVSHIETRYINRIDLPEDNTMSIESYLTLYPNIPDSSKEVSGYSLQILRELDSIDSVLTMAIYKTNRLLPDQASIMLEIRINRTLSEPLDQKGILLYMNMVRREKNDAFESAITDKLKKELNK